jgi:hypothetical protein
MVDVPGVGAGVGIGVDPPPLAREPQSVQSVPRAHTE